MDIQAGNEKDRRHNSPARGGAGNFCRLRFGLRSVFAMMTVMAWCTWQWTIALQRDGVADQLQRIGYLTYRDSTVRREGLDRLYLHEVLNPRKHGERIWRSAVLAITGIDNWGGLTVMVGAPSDLSLTWMTDRLDMLERLPGLTTVVIWSGDPERLSGRAVDEYERKLREKLPRVKIKRVVVPPLPVGGAGKGQEKVSGTNY